MKPFRRIAPLLLVCAAVFAAPGAFASETLVRLATTTSTDNSGLLRHLLPQFERESGYRVQVISAGTGKALKLGESGDVDVVLVHAPKSERRFMDLGHGVDRRTVMENDFILVGPRADPAGLRRAASAADAFRRMHRAAHAFVSRGDDSGTHKKELSLWRAARVDVAGENAWRLEVGRGMGASLQIAGELQAYMLIDRATWLFAGAQSELQLLYEGGAELRNPYGVIAVNPARHHVNYPGARALIEWLVSERGQSAIGGYTAGGARLFTPSAR
ncbi:MAG: substrate-binding domain-containing protein [Gammaproteobacteria bacterium]|nr:substrate-binding domain-containing protein [Gammaproteobacteria bacterium]